MGDVFKALADPTRRAILDELAERNGQTRFELSARLVTRHQLGMSRQAISQHIDLLVAAGLVRTRHEGRYTFHDFDPTPWSTSSIGGSRAHLSPRRSPDRPWP